MKPWSCTAYTIVLGLLKWGHFMIWSIYRAVYTIMPSSNCIRSIHHALLCQLVLVETQSICHQHRLCESRRPVKAWGNVLRGQRIINERGLEQSRILTYQNFTYNIAEFLLRLVANLNPLCDSWCSIKSFFNSFCW